MPELWEVKMKKNNSFTGSKVLAQKELEEGIGEIRKKAKAALVKF